MNVAKRIVEGVLLPNAAGTAQYTAPVNVSCLLKKVTFLNTSALAAVTLTVHLVPPAGAVLDANMVCKAKTLYPGERFELFEAENQLLAPGGALNAFAGTANLITMTATGIEMT